MAIDTLRMTVGFFVILSHLVSFSMILLGGSLSTDERVELSLLISPIFAVYVTAIVRHIVTMEQFDRTKVHPALAMLGVGVAVIFAIAVPVVVWNFETGRIDTFGSLKSIIGIVETSLGLYTGTLVERLFGRSVPSSNQANQPNNGAT